MSSILIAIFAYLIDKIFGEFTFMIHPLSYVKEMSSYFVKNYYKKSVLRGLLHLLFVIGIISFFIISITLFLALTPLVVNIVVSSLIAAMFLSNASVKRAFYLLRKKKIQKQTFTELAKHNTNIKKLNEALVAPLLYLLFFCLIGIVLYKTIHTLAEQMDSKERRVYATSARLLHNGVNFFPSRFIALLIVLRNWR